MECSHEPLPAASLAIHCGLSLCGVPFQAMFAHKSGEIVVEAAWEDRAHPLGLVDLASAMGFDLSWFSSWDIALTKAAVAYQKKSKRFSFQVHSLHYGVLTVASSPEGFSASLGMDKILPCMGIPVLGQYFQAEDGLHIQKLTYIRTAKGGKVALDFSLTLFGNKIYPSKKGALAAKTPSDIHWIQLDKSIRAVTLRRVGFALGDGTIQLYLDASVQISVLSVTLDGLCASVPMNLDPTRLGFSLSGLSISYQSGPLAFGGGLIRSQTDSHRFDGSLLIKFSGFCLSALASYTELEGKTSLFLYAYVGIPLGGPPAFRITGLCGSFGLNRALQVPDIKKIANFPLVSAALTGKGPKTVDEALLALRNVVTPKLDCHFAAAGITFDSFGIAQSFGLAIVSFGRRFELDLLGITTLSLPPKSSSPIAKATLLLKVHFAPEDGIFSAEAALAEDSYVLDKNCRLTGGFAFYLWFGGPNKGDFVISLGGYHPNFKLPAHYPRVNRLGIHWQIDSHLSLTGSAYCALTSSCVMAGGSLELVYCWGALRAWFIARADFLLQWKPLHYDISVYISLGASYRVDFLFIHHTFSLELTASLHLYGPELGGSVHIKWLIISFTVSFGEKPSPPPPLNWSEFQTAFLSEPPLSLRAETGFQAEPAQGQPWLFSSASFSLCCETRIPATSYRQNAGTVTYAANTAALGIHPMQERFLNSPLTVAVSRHRGGNQWEPVDQLSVQPLYNSFPPALWSAEETNLNSAPLAGLLTGLRLLSPPAAPSHRTPESGGFDLETLLNYEAWDFHIHSWQPPPAPSRTYRQEEALHFFSQSDTPSVCIARNNLLHTLNGLGFSLPMPPSLRILAAQPEKSFRSLPVLCSTAFRKEAQG